MRYNQLVRVLAAKLSALSKDDHTATANKLETADAERPPNENEIAAAEALSDQTLCQFLVEDTVCRHLASLLMRPYDLNQEEKTVRDDWYWKQVREREKEYAKYHQVR